MARFCRLAVSDSIVDVIDRERKVCRRPPRSSYTLARTQELREHVAKLTDEQLLPFVDMALVALDERVSHLIAACPCLNTCMN